MVFSVSYLIVLFAILGKSSATSTFTVSTAKEAVLYCTIHGISTTTASVTWTDENGADADTIDGYSTTPGVFYNNEQTTTLEITPSFLSSAACSTTFTCTFTLAAADLGDAFAEVVHLKKLSYGVEVTSMEIGAWSDVTISCQVSGITEDVSIVWLDEDENDLAYSDTGYYEIDEGLCDPATNSQTSTMTIDGVANSKNEVYHCVVTSEEWEIEDDEYEVELNVYEVEVEDVYIVRDEEVVVTCYILGVSATASVVWRNDDEDNVSGIVGYSTETGSEYNQTQESTLTISKAAVELLTNATRFACVVKSGEYADYSPEVISTQYVMKVANAYTSKTVAFTAVITMLLVLFLLLIGVVIFARWGTLRRR